MGPGKSACVYRSNPDGRKTGYPETERQASVSAHFCGALNGVRSSAEIQLHEPISIARRGSAVKLILSNGECESHAPIASLVRAVVQARTWSEWIVAGKVRNLEELAAKASLNKRHASRILRLAALSPTLYEAILVYSCSSTKMARVT
jgi:hypothetical protein